METPDARTCLLLHGGLSSFPMVKKRSTGKKKGITIRDVVIHMQGMEQRLTKEITANTVAIKYVNSRINDVETNLVDRIDGLGKDIDVTMMDTIKIRQHVGMALPDDE